MKEALLGLQNSFRDTKTWIVFFISAAVIKLSYFALANGEVALKVFSFDSYSYGERALLFIRAFFDTTQLFGSTSTLVLVGLVATFGGLVITLYTRFVSLRKDALKRGAFLSGIALVMAALGVGCAACGAVLLVTLLGFFGMGGVLVYFPYHGVEIGYLGAVLLVVISYLLLKRLASPYTC